MKTAPTSQAKTARRLAWLTAAACVGCCAVPALGLALGFSAIAGLGVYFERAALGFFLASAGLFLYVAFKRTRTSCKVDCGCKAAASGGDQQQ